MDTKKISPVLFISVTSIIFAIELMVQQLPLEPLMQTGTARCLEIIFIFMTFKIFNDGLNSIGLSTDRIGTGFKKGIIWSAGFGLLTSILGAALFLSGINPLKLLHMRLPETIPDIFMLYIVGGLIAPVAEEIFFRGVIYGFIKEVLSRKLNKWSIPAALIISTYLFVIAHQTGAGIPLPQLVGGIVFCISYEIEKSLITPIIIHSLGNIALFTISFF